MDSDWWCVPLDRDDGNPEVAISACDVFSLYDVAPTGMTPLFQTTVADSSGSSCSTAFE